MPLSSAQKAGLLADVAALKSHVDALVPDAVAQPDVQQDSPVPNFDWLEGTPATLNVLGHFSSPSGKTLALAPAGTMPAGVAVSGGSLVYDGSGSFRTLTDVPLSVTAA